MKPARRTRRRSKRVSFSLYLPRIYHFSFLINSKKSKPAKTRNPKLPGRIEELTAKDIESAIGLARLGVQLTHIQQLLQRYYLAKFDCDMAKSGKRGEISLLMERDSGNIWDDVAIGVHNSFMQHYAATNLEELCQIFEKSVIGGDAKKIVEIGRGIEFLRTIATKESKGEGKGDRYRTEILYWKNILDKRREKWPIRKLAEKIGWPMEDSINGFSKLRRMAEKLNFPLELQHR